MNKVHLNVSIHLFSTIIMHIHLRYGSEKEEHIIVFDEKIITVADVLHKAKKRYGKNPRLILLNDNNIHLKENILVEKGKSYRIKRR